MENAVASKNFDTLFFPGLPLFRGVPDVLSLMRHIPSTDIVLLPSRDLGMMYLQRVE